MNLNVKNLIDILSYISKDVALKKVSNTHGGEWAGPCPFCGGRDRMRVWPALSKWTCRQCKDMHMHDIIDYVKERYNVNFKDAIAILGQPENRKEHRKPLSEMISRIQPGSDDKVWQKQANTMTEQAQNRLWSGSPELITQNLSYLRGRGLKDSTILEYKLGMTDHGYSIPSFGQSGDIGYIKIRSFESDVGNDQPKYRYMKGSHPGLFFNWKMLENSKPEHLLFCEGEFDAMILAQELAPICAVATIGSTTGRIGDDTLELVKLFKNLWTLYDFDSPGIKAELRLTRELGAKPVPIVLNGKDANEAFVRGQDLSALIIPVIQGTVDVEESLE
ncbi:MAG: hypothetical protein HGA95_00115 [Caldiserica bacterium]|nr:hypothetical protein [Caldisericota bacterium]